MRQAIAILAVGALPLIGCTPAPERGWSGYVEGEFVQLAAAQSGRLVALPAVAGAAVHSGEVLFTLDATVEQALATQARAQLGAAEAVARNSASGRRADEIAVTRAQRVQASAQATLARAELLRQERLFEQQFVSAAAIDDAKAALVQADARVAELDAALRVAALPARQEEQRAAQAQAQAASAALAQSRWRLDQMSVAAPAAGRVADTYYRVGEWVAAGQPVVALLPVGAVKARFFVPETELADLAPGQPVTIRCDGCGAPIAARISVIATQVEYTPPVIYSNAQRARLVYRVEARPDAAGAARLRPGLPVDVRRAPS